MKTSFFFQYNISYEIIFVVGFDEDPEWGSFS